MFSTKIVRLDCKQNDPMHIDCVQTVHYQHIKKDDLNTAVIQGTINLNLPNELYVPFSQLTEDKVLLWCGFDNKSIEDALDAQLQQMRTPSVIGKPAPWGQS